MKGISPPPDFQALPVQNGNRLFGCMSNGSDSSSILRNNHEHRTLVTIDSDEDDNDSYKKDKETVVDKVRIGLHVVIRRAIDLDDSSRNFNNKHYNVVFWVVPGQEFRTKIIEGVIPVWNEADMVEIESIDDHVFLNIEVQRFNSKSDPGTSCGKVVVGRAKIPIPKELYRYRSGFISLVKNEDGEIKPAGRIMVGTRLERI
ncbi:hypothetical protein HN51_031288 [Arachis hypogaea]|nr:uncharacterized protein DS421_10g298900 [Arachis hypogaea]